MHRNRPITDALSTTRPVVSVEFYPPKNEEGGQQILRSAAEVKARLKPDFVSITYGAGGSTRERTQRYARILKEEYGFEVMPHLTCVGSTEGELHSIVRAYQEEGFCNLMLLRGDPPKGTSTFVARDGGPRYASDLVSLVRRSFSGFCLGVAGYPEKHPEAPDLETDLRFLKHKCDQGASFITTQLFFDNAVYFDFVRRCRAAGITLPILPGLLPALSLSQVRRFCQFCGSHLPEPLERSLEQAGGEGRAAAAVGVAWAARQIRELLAGGAPGYHLYILNQSGPALAVLEKVREETSGIPRIGRA